VEVPRRRTLAVHLVAVVPGEPVRRGSGARVGGVVRCGAVPATICSHRNSLTRFNAESHSARTRNTIFLDQSRLTHASARLRRTASVCDSLIGSAVWRGRYATIAGVHGGQPMISYQRGVLSVLGLA